MKDFILYYIRKTWKKIRTQTKEKSEKDKNSDKDSEKYKDRDKVESVETEIGVGVEETILDCIRWSERSVGATLALSTFSDWRWDVSIGYLGVRIQSNTV